MSYIPFMVCYVFNEKQNGVCQFIGEFDLIFVCTFFGASFIGIINVWQYYVILTDITTVEMILVLRKKEKKAWIPYIIETFIKNASFKNVEKYLGNVNIGNFFFPWIFDSINDKTEIDPKKTS